MGTATKPALESRPARVLIAEGDPINLTHVRTLLGKSGYDVTVARDGWHALELLESQNPPALAVLDWTMPGLNGIEICRRLRRSNRPRVTHVILLTRWNQQNERVEALEAGADDCLYKPVDVRELRIRLQIGAQIIIERALLESEARFRTAFECAGIGMAVLKISGEFLQASRALCDLLGYTVEELVGMTFHALVSSGDSPNSQVLLQQFLKAGQPSREFEGNFVTKSGLRVCTSSTISVVLDSEEHPACFVLQVQDVTERKRSEKALQESLAASKQALKELSDQKYAMDQHAIVATTDVQGNITYVNDKFCSISKYSREELIGQNHRIVNSGYHSKEFFQHLYQTISRGGVWQGEIRNRAKDGSIYWVDTTIVPLLDARGKLRQYIAIRAEITERKAAEEALRRSEGLLRAINDNLHDLILVLDSDHRWKYVNPASVEVLGYTPAELIGTDAWAIIHPDDQAAVAEAAKEVFSGMPGRVIQFRWRHKDGRWRYIESQASLLRSSNGAIEGRVLVARLIDDRLLAQQKLQAAHAETELFLRSIPSILIGLDEEGRITRWNLTAATTFGLDAADVLGRKIEESGIQWAHPDMPAEVAKWLSTGTSYRREDLAYEREGKSFFVSLEVRRISPKESERPGFIVTGADSTQRKGLEEQLRQAQKLEAIGQLAAGIAHEINTPTQYVSDNITFLKDSWGASADFLDFCNLMRAEAEGGSVSPESHKKFIDFYEKGDFGYLMKEIPRALDQSLEGLQRVAKIVRGMKEFSHPGSKEKRAVNLNQAIDSTITVARHEWKYCAELVTAFDPALPLVPCLAGEFNQVMLNLIINAAHAIVSALGENSSEKGTITITTRLQTDWAEIAVADTGSGIPEEIRSRIFDPFFTTKEVGKGTGQGLALAHSVIVKLHQGQLWFETELGRGTTFFIRLPLDTGVAVT